MNDATTQAEDGFDSIGLSEEVTSTLVGLGYEEPTPIQREAIPPLLAGRDLLGQAATGTLREGTAITLAEPHESRMLETIDQHIGQEIRIEPAARSE